MILKNSQQDLVFDLPNYYKNVGMKISGGADSAIVALALTRYIKTERPDMRIVPITVNHEGKAYQEQFSKSVIEHLRATEGDWFNEHEVGYCAEGPQYISSQDSLVSQLYRDGIIDCHYVGITKNPPNDVMQTMSTGHDGVDHDRTPLTKLRPTSNGDNTSFKPLVNIDKKGVAELYETLGVMDSLFPLTRSCENFTDDFSHHCGECWWCKERHWGFGRLE
ncbi:7-cyano-7-deazaguanine synthase [bacterium]|nr:7-cyano-7-deazaguanine synthase [bacterium]